MNQYNDKPNSQFKPMFLDEESASASPPANSAPNPHGHTSRNHSHSHPHGHPHAPSTHRPSHSHQALPAHPGSQHSHQHAASHHHHRTPSDAASTPADACNNVGDAEAAVKDVPLDATAMSASDAAAAAAAAVVAAATVDSANPTDIDDINVDDVEDVEMDDASTGPSDEKAPKAVGSKAQMTDVKPSFSSGPLASMVKSSHINSNDKFQSYLLKKKLKINKSPKFLKKQRSRSLPIISYNGTHNSNTVTINNNQSGSGGHKKSLVPPLPPINLTSLKEIDLNEILKNPQLRHDIIFDPQLQFRPNLDGERGKRKSVIINKYWTEIMKECQQFYDPQVLSNPQEVPRIVRLPILFQTLKDILISLLPVKDRHLIHDMLDIELILQQLKQKYFDFLKLATLLNQIFKIHCAPMRDTLVNQMLIKFELSFKFNNVELLIEGLKLIFQILECMKLDIANHQIRMLRPILIETAIDFEKDYFSQLISQHRINLQDSVNWFQKNMASYEQQGKLAKYNANATIDNNQEIKGKITLVNSVFELLSCKKMINEFPQCLIFDHTRLILLRADIRQIIVLRLCINLYQSLVLDHFKNTPVKKTQLLSSETVNQLKQEILSIVTDNNGNIKWTKNINLISLQINKTLFANEADKTEEDTKKVLKFSNNWLIKQIQPSNTVYQLMESNYFNGLFKEIEQLITTHQNPSVNQVNLNNISNRILILINFNWSVFNEYYLGTASE